MNEQLQQQLAEYLKAIAATAEKGSAFVVEQAPLVVQEKIALGRVIETGEFLVLLGMTLLLARGARALWRAAKADDFDNPAYPIGGAFASGGALFAFGFMVEGFQDMATVWFAPRLYILEWAMGLIK